MTLTDSQLAEINERSWAYDTVGQSTEEFERHAFTDMALLMGHISELNRQLSTIRKEATDAERERAAGIAKREGMLVQSQDGNAIGYIIAQAIRAPTGDEGK